MEVSKGPAAGQTGERSYGGQDTQACSSAKLDLCHVDLQRDLEVLMRVMSRSRHSPAISSNTAFVAWLQHKLDREFTLLRVLSPVASARAMLEPGTALGCVVARDYRPLDGHARMEVLLDGSAIEHAVDQGHLPACCSLDGCYAIAASGALRRLFAAYPLRKVFLESLEGDLTPYGWDAWGTALPSLVHEVRLKEYAFWGGAYRDVNVWSLGRAAWDGFKDIRSEEGR